MAGKLHRNIMPACILAVPVFLLLLVLFPLSGARADNASPPLPAWNTGESPFPTCDPRVFLAKTFSTPDTLEITGVQLVSINLNAPPPQLTMDDVGSQHPGYTYNAMGYNPQDDYLYAIKQSPNGADNKDLIRIGADGDPKYVATLSNILAKAIIGEFDLDGYFHVVDELRNYYKYDLSGPTPQLVTSSALVVSGTATSFQDFGLFDGYLWAITSSVSGAGGGTTTYRILRIPLTGPATPEMSPTRVITGQQMVFTSVFAAKNGVYAYDTTAGNFVKIDMSSNDINQMDLQFLAKGETLPGSDGAKCQTAPLGLPAEIVVTKSASQTVLTPGQPVDFTIIVENTGPWGAVGISFDDPLPAGATGSTWSCATSAPAATCAPASGSGAISAMLDMPERNQTVTFQVTMQTDPGASADLVNAATVTVPEDFADDLGNNTGIATVPVPSLDFTVAKTGTLMGQGGAFTSAGDVINYTVTVKNDSALPFTSVTVSDPGPQFGGVAGTGALSAFQPASATLAPNEEAAFTATYTITEQDLANLAQSGIVDVVNTASATVTGQSGQNTQEASSTVQAVAPAIHLDKTGVLVDLVGGPSTDVGDRIDYTLTISNTGSVALENIVLTDAFVQDLTLEQSDLDTNGVLAPGKTVIYRASHIITEADLIKGQVENSATVTANVAGRTDLPQVQHTDGHVEALTASSSILVEKIADSSGMLNAGDPIVYIVRLTNGGLGPLEEVYPLDQGPTFGGKPGTGTLSTFVPGPVALGPGDTAEFRATYILSESDVQNAVGPDSIRNVATATGRKPDGTPVEQVNVAEAVISPTSVVVTKMAPIRKAMRGGAVPFVLTAKAPGASEPLALDLVDTIPVGFSYLANSARINGQPVEPGIHGRRLVFPVDVRPDEVVEINLQLFVTATVNPGEHTNFAHAELAGTGVPVGQRVAATVEVDWEHVFDCGDLVGKVFTDKNRNGAQDHDEPGVAGARLVAVDGLTITTDSHGRFHLTCADLPDRRKGTNFMLKLDPRSLPSGHRIVSENPRAVRLTAGKVTTLNFATSVARVVRVDINSDAFLLGEVLLRQEWHSQLMQLIAILQNEPSILRVSYIDRDLDRSLAAKRVEFLRDLIRQLWEERSGRYRLEIESRILSQLGQGWNDPSSISWVVEAQQSGQVREFER